MKFNILKTLLLSLLMAVSVFSNAGIINLDYKNTLVSALSDPNSNFSPQGLGYDTGSNELLYMQQSTNTIFRTDLFGNIVGTREIGTLPFYPSGSTTSTANHTTSVAGDGSNYYFTDYTANSSGYDLYGIGTTSGTANAISSEVAGYGGYPIDVRDGILYRTEASNSYGWGTLNEIRISNLNSVDSISNTVTLNTGFGIGDIAVDSLRNQIWTIDYSSTAFLRQFDLNTGDLLQSFDLELDGLTAGITYANDKLYYYDWNSGQSSTLSAYSLDSTEVPEPSTLAIFGLALMGLASRKFKKS